METEVRQSREPEPVIQFSIFADNKVGRLNELMQRLAQRDLHVMAVTQLDSTECTIIRLIPDYPEDARQALGEHGYAFTESAVIVAEMHTEADLKFITAALVEAEINIHYLYSFVSRPNGRSAMVLNVEDNDLAESVLKAHQIRCLTRGDIAR